MIRLVPDVQGEGVVWTHRQADGADWYFVAAPVQRGFRGTLRFRAVGRVELWNPLTGAVAPASGVRRDGATTFVALDLPPSSSTFIVFGGSDHAAGHQIVRVEHDGHPVMDTRTSHREGSGSQVVSASYGDPANPARRKDVTELVRRALARGVTTIIANNDWAGGDPALKTRKKLFVTLRSPNGQEMRLETDEHAPLTLADSTPRPRLAGEIVDGGTRFQAWEPGMFRVTRDDGKISSWETRVPRSVPLAGPWYLEFPAGWGAPASLRLDKLASWTELDVSSEAKAFSGTAIYTTEFTVDPSVPDARVELELGRVEVIASVRVNGEAAGTLWLPPYRLDITRLVKPGVNHLSVAVTSTWFNRLVFDAGLDEKARKTWTISGPASNKALEPAGWLGPAMVRVGQTLDFSDTQ
jgi:hypothetical protein